MIKHSVALLALATLAACGTSTKKDPQNPHEPEAAQTSSGDTRATALSRDAAHLRAKQISRVSYTLWIGLDETHDDYEGRVVINFELRPKGQELSKTLLLDFEQGTIRALSLNGQALMPGERFDGHRITLKSSELAAGANRVEVAFNHPFSHNGSGLHRFKDPVDSKVYLYTDFEPYDAHRMFPCFDQPDLKASYELTVEAPESWQIISNTMEREVAKVDGRKSWQFPPSPVFSTYLFALHAGPYAVWKGNADGIPMRLFARQSIKQYVDHEEWLKVTSQGLAWFGEYFGYPYPYAKYDQIIVPDFNAGAMENVAAVTFAERYVYRSKATLDRHRGRANTILHEMAHMWFGDLVTMRWWNGLWLNESFATFMATKAVDEATSFKGSWQDFFAGSKSWAYWEDQLVTTHSIEVPVADTDQATSNFDGITYGKGASTLKQLHYLLGDEDFREGLQRYFQKFANRNTTVGDFIKMLSEASTKDLSAWQKSWLQLPGVNTLKAEWACADGKVSAIKLMQSMPELAESAKELRSHKTMVGLYNTRGGKLRAGKSATVTYSAVETPVTELVGAPCPDYVNPNAQDYDYVKVELDPVSLKTVQEKLSKIEDPLERVQTWHVLWEMVTDGKLKTQDYAETVLQHLAAERDTQVLARVLRTLADPNPLTASVLKYLGGEQRKEFAARIEKFARMQLSRAPGGSDLQLIWYHAYLDAARSEEGLAYTHKLLTGKAKVSGLKIDQERRWEIIQSLSRAGFAELPQLVAEELKLDNTDMGQKEAIRAQASSPVAATKQQWLDDILGRKQPFPKLREAMRAYHVQGHEESSRSAVDAYFAMIPKLPGLGDEEYMRTFAARMYPALCDPTTAQKTAVLLSDHPGLPATVLKPLRVGKQEEERCVRARAKSEKSDTPVPAQPTAG